MAIPKINSAHGSETRNIINTAIDSINVQGKSIQDLVIRGQLTPSQFAELLNKTNDSSPKGAYATLTDLQNAYPNGADGIYVVTADGNWYYYDGSAWQSGGVYQTTQWQNALTTQNEDWVI